MRPPVDEASIRALARSLSKIATSAVDIYLSGGATAVIEGWRDSTVDIDILIEPELDEVLKALSGVKDALGVNIELVSPPDFIPELPSWRDRSPVVLKEGHVQIRHFDPYSQALAKIERGFKLDIEDIRTMISRSLVTPERMFELFVAIEPELYRYPAIDPADFRAKVKAVCLPSN